MTTAVLRLSSDLQRRKWMREGLVQAASKSFWSPMTGNSSNSVIHQVNNSTAKEGHTVVFDYNGNLSGKAIRGKETAYGKGETKRKFSDKLTVERYRLVVDNGDEFDAVDIGDLSLSQHSDSRSKLADLFVRFKDQAIFDTAQGNYNGLDTSRQRTPSHIIDLGSDFSFNVLLDIERTLKTSQGYTTGGVRRPLDPWMVKDDQPCWAFVLDSAMANILRADTDGYQTIVAQGDVRGDGNRNIKGVIGRIGALLLIEAPQFFGETAGTQVGWGLNDSEIEISGLRQYAGADPANSPWTGQEGFDYDSDQLHSRGLILGKTAFQFGMGRMPDYKWKESDDFGITSESAVEFWMDTQKTTLRAENTDYKQAKIADLDYGVIAVDLQVS